jgi:two-component system nitrate/nitrite sensor histidine kinase NarX
MMLMLQSIARKPILVSIGLLMSAIVLLAVVSMVSSVFVAQTMEGMASAINQSGSLRMQSYRIGVALADERAPAPLRAERAATLAAEFESRLFSPRLVNAIPGHTDHEVTQAYAQVTRHWERTMKPPLADHIALLRGDAANGSQAPQPLEYLAGVDAFVAEIDALVHLLEDVAERRIDILRWIQATALGLTVIVVILTMFLMVRRVIRPLGELLSCADSIRQGDFSGRTRVTGSDELGRLGAAVNMMSEGLSQLYGALEQRVEEKTRDLARTNHSLELLYRTSKVLNEEPVSDQLLRRVLDDIQDHVKTGPATLCLSAEAAGNRGTLLVSTRPGTDHDWPCWDQGCRACLDADHCRTTELEGVNGNKQRLASFPVGDREQHLGVLMIDLVDDEPLLPWQRRLLSTLAGHIGTALNLQRRVQESRRLVLHEERGIIARELHDSLAQSLSYLKIQVTRLAAALDAPSDAQQARTVLDELREGISSAYRQLRELLATFRLKMDDGGLSRALEETVKEFRQRGTVDIRLDNRLAPALLTPNEEIHVLQIVREALSNVVRHARAGHAWVSLRPRAGGVEVEVRDDGRGAVLPADEARHYGMAIMRERSLNLGGELEVTSAPAAGTSVHLHFRHRSSGRADTQEAETGPRARQSGFAGATH